MHLCGHNFNLSEKNFYNVSIICQLDRFLLFEMVLRNNQVFNIDIIAPGDQAIRTYHKYSVVFEPLVVQRSILQ
jgi:hypothetical protein